MSASKPAVQTQQTTQQIDEETGKATVMKHKSQIKRFDPRNPNQYAVQNKPKPSNAAKAPTLREQGRLEVIKPLPFSTVFGDSDDEKNASKAEPNKVVKVAAQNWQNIIQTSLQNRGLPKEDKTEFKIEESVMPAAEKPSGGFCLDFGAAEPLPLDEPVADLDKKSKKKEKVIVTKAKKTSEEI